MWHSWKYFLSFSAIYKLIQAPNIAGLYVANFVTTHLINVPTSTFLSPFEISYSRKKLENGRERERERWECSSFSFLAGIHSVKLKWVNHFFSLSFFSHLRRRYIVNCIQDDLPILADERVKKGITFSRCKCIASDKNLLISFIWLLLFSFLVGQSQLVSIKNGQYCWYCSLSW